jgi:formylglycine-generating enzyme required for sulfatase activity
MFTQLAKFATFVGRAAGPSDFPVGRAAGPSIQQSAAWQAAPRKTRKRRAGGPPHGAMGLALALLLVCAQTLVAAEPRRVALLVGVNRYEKRGFAEHPLRFAERDVAELAQVLKQHDFEEPRVLTGSATGANRAEKKQIDDALTATLKGLSAHDIVLLALAGHGEQMEAPVKQRDGTSVRQEDAFFCPVDAEKGEPTTLISLTALVERLDRKGGTNLLLVDACRDDPSRGARAITGNELVGRLPSNTALLFGCSAGQQALETAEAGGGHGVFFFNVLAGLRGKAANQRGEITWQRLADFVQENVNQDAIKWFPARAKQLAADEELQTPHQLANLNRLPVLARVSLEREMAPSVGRAAGPSGAPVGRAAGPSGPLVGRAAGPSPPDTPDGPAARPTEKTFSNSIGMKFTLIPAGSFMMGSPESENGHRSDEGPRHRVRITQPFYMGVYEVTQAEYERVTGDNPSYFSSGGSGAKSISGLNTDGFPVEQVNWEDAVAFCEKLTALAAERADRRHYRLPTEAEWEYACRAGTTTPFSFGSELSGRGANCYGKRPYGTTVEGPFLIRTTAVGSYRDKVNDFGLFDMHGNVWEWCSDWYDAGYYANSPPDDPQGPAAGSFRVIRGGGWYSSPVLCRSAYRRLGTPADRDYSIGFRVLCGD